MGKPSQIDRAIANLEAEIDDRQRALTHLKAVKDESTPQPKEAPKSRAKRRGRSNGEGATTDSGNMNYPPA